MTKKILESLNRFFTVNPDWIPENVTLRLCHYDENGDVKILYTIKGTGQIDYGYRETLIEMHKNAFANKKEAMKDANGCYRPIDVAAHLNVMEIERPKLKQAEYLTNQKQATQPSASPSSSSSQNQPKERPTAAECSPFVANYENDMATFKKTFPSTSNDTQLEQIYQNLYINCQKLIYLLRNKEAIDTNTVRKFEAVFCNQIGIRSGTENKDDFLNRLNALHAEGYFNKYFCERDLKSLQPETSEIVWDTKKIAKKLVKSISSPTTSPTNTDKNRSLSNIVSSTVSSTVSSLFPWRNPSNGNDIPLPLTTTSTPNPKSSNLSNGKR